MLDRFAYSKPFGQLVEQPSSASPEARRTDVATATPRTARRSDFVYSRGKPQYRSYQAAHFASALPLLRRPVHVDLWLVNIVCNDGFHRRPPLHFRFGIPTSTPPQQCCMCILHAMGRN